MVHRIIKCGDYSLEFGKRTLIMGIINVTPDSFSDGGQFSDSEKAIEHGKRIVKEGVDLIDRINKCRCKKAGREV